MNSVPRLLVLYAEVMPYNVICFQHFVEEGKGEMMVISWDETRKLTPYKPPPSDGIIYLSFNDFDQHKLNRLIDSFQPSALYVAGRMEKKYLKASLYARQKNIPVIGTYDNQYDGSWKQRVMKILSPALFKRYFNYMMVPGIYQYEFMRYIGYNRKQILFPQYCADTRLFRQYYEQHNNCHPQKKYILFVGRLNVIKGLDILIDAFQELKKENSLSLKLLIIGNGPLKDSIPDDKDIEVHGFMEQKDIISRLPAVKFFCLPSINEPWGLVVHEFAAAGLPIITTNICGAATAFVKHNYNGILVPPSDKKRLKEAILKLNKLSEKELDVFGNRSYELSKQISPELWTCVIKSVIEQ